MQFLKKGLIMLLLLKAVNGFSQTMDDDKPSAWQLNATYKGDFVSNFHGGIATGSTYLGLADLYLHFNTEKAGLWKGGDFLVRGANSHGGQPSANLIGDFQTVSNIEAGNHTFLYELWYKQTISNVTATFGLHDLNAEFANSDIGSLFLNSLFGVHSVISDNILAPIFPLTSPGITFCWKTSEKINLKTAVYKGCPIDFDSNPYNIKWDLNHLQGLLWVTEGQYTWKGNQEQNNVLKAGVFFHQHCPESDVVNSETGNKLTHDYGFYMVGDHQVWSKGTRRLSIFYQLGISPRNDNFAYLGAGRAYSGLFSRNGTDVFGLAMADGMLTKERGRDETTFELTYKVQLTNQIYLQPDMQYVVHSGGTDVQLKNATVALLRLGMEFKNSNYDFTKYRTGSKEHPFGRFAYR
jgi:porin